MYKINVNYSFNASHSLADSAGGKEPAHPHEWKIEVEISSEKLDNQGCVADFREVDLILQKATANWQNGSVGDFSAEMLAEKIYFRIKDSIERMGCRLVKVSSFEDEHHSASFYL